MTSDGLAWVCCQLGAREHFAVPRALRASGNLAEVITDFWMAPRQTARRLYPRSLRERYHADLNETRVRSFNRAALVFEAGNALRIQPVWDGIIRRNEWFQDRALRELAKIAERSPGSAHRLFAYSYAARRLLEFAKSRGWTTVLGQIDPGLADERIGAAAREQYPDLGAKWMPAPARYWKNWREECRLADIVMVNSTWSARALIQESVPREKLRVVPLAYEPSCEATEFQRSYPSEFSGDRPLRVLFLGQVSIRKGVAAIFEAMALLHGAPVQFWFVGRQLIQVPSNSAVGADARWVGSVARGEVEQYYRDCDVFLFPTLSDGFGLTQLEAQAWKLPIIASRRCGDVVKDGVNGLLLDDVSGVAIAEAIRQLVAMPSRLAALSRGSISASEFGLERLKREFETLFPPD